MSLMKVRYLNVFDMSGFTHCVLIDWYYDGFVVVREQEWPL